LTAPLFAFTPWFIFGRITECAMKSFIRSPRILLLPILALALVVRVQGVAITLTPSSPTLLVGQTVQLTANGAVTPTAIATGGWHSCVMYSDQTVRCTGLNNQGEIGNNSYFNVSQPTLSIGTENPVALLTGMEHTCTFVGDGRMQCWGTNYTGQLGDGTMGGFAMAPQFVHNITNAIKGVTGGFHTCAILPDHTVECWGRNQDGQIGNGDSTTDVPLPVPVSGLGPVADLSAGGYHTCALMADHSARCWGRNGRGQLGDGTVNSASTPVPVSGLTTAAVLKPGGYHTCALLTDGTVQCWGQSDWGQIGSPGMSFSSVPVTVSGIGRASAVSGGAYHSCALLADGTVWCWGRNDSGQLGDGTTVTTATPVQVRGIVGPIAIAAGGFHTCALMRDASVQCWGEGDYGELGTGTTSNSPTPVKMNTTGMTWSTSDPTVATVDATGVVTGVGRGTATITASDPFGNTGSTTVTVRTLLTLGVLRQGDGLGDVTSAPGGISCPTTCSGSFVSDSQVVLTASPGVNSLFTGWTGCDSVSGATCTVTMANARTVTAIFMLKRFTLTVTKSGIGNGTVTSNPSGINCGSACASDFVINTNVTLTATPALGSIFTGWTGCDSTTDTTCTVAMTNKKTVTASFLGLPLQ
jgi:alpha-tubulin suppressor-like RCC1 family protein